MYAQRNREFYELLKGFARPQETHDFISSVVLLMVASTQASSARYHHYRLTDEGREEKGREERKSK